MTEKIMRSMLAVTITVLLISTVFFTGFLYDYFGDIQAEQLKDELALASVATEDIGLDYLTGIKSENYRLTLIAADGTVMYDTEAVTAEMPNHADREEFKEAKEFGYGSSSRYSSTLTAKTLYEAVELSDGSVLRISIGRANIVLLLLGMLSPALFIIIIAVILSAVFAHRMAKKITEPLNDIDLERPLDNEAYEELSPLLNRINRQQRQIGDNLRKLEQKKNEFAKVTDNMKEALLLLDGNGRILSINPAAMRLFNTDKYCVGEDLLTVERSHDISLAVETAFENGHCEIRVERNERQYQFDISRIETGGKNVGAVLLAFDITEQAYAERLRREFSANVSHELKTPLQAIIGSAELIENDLVRPEDLPRFVGHIRNEATRLVNLVEDIIGLSQLDEGGDMPREEVSLYALANEVLYSLQDEADKKNITLSVTGDSGNINAVRRLIYEIVYNLCDNAIKYNVDGGKVTVDIRDDSGSVMCKVTDTGIGIPAEHQPRVFERFYRVDKSHSKQSGGTGLGLSIVKHAVQYHGGSIELTSERGKGSEFTVRLPKRL